MACLDLTVLLFTKEQDSPGVVASRWLRFNDTMTYWPSFARSQCQIEKLMTDASIVPNSEEGWELCPVRVLQKGIANLLEARALAKEAEVTSDLELNRTKRPLKPVQKFGYDSSSEDEITSVRPNKAHKRQSGSKRLVSPKENVCPNAPVMYDDSAQPATFSFNAPVKMRNSNSNASTNISNANQLHANNRAFSSVTSPDNANRLKSTVSLKPTPLKPLHINNTSSRVPGSFPETLGSLESSSEYAKENLDFTLENGMDLNLKNGSFSSDALFRKLLYIQRAVEANGRMLKASSDKFDLLRVSCNPSEEILTPNIETDLAAMLPCKNDETLIKINNMLLQSNAARIKCTKILALAGGNCTRTKLTSMMRRIMTDDVAVLYSFKGQGHQSEKKSFSDLQVFKIIKAVIQGPSEEALDATDTFIKDVIGEWLTQAKHRRGRKILRASRNQMDENTESNPRGTSEETSEQSSLDKAQLQVDIALIAENGLEFTSVLTNATI